MTWNYRVFKEKTGEFVIREVYYEDDGSIMACTERPVEPMGESLEELARDIDWFKEATTLPALTLADIPHNSIKRSKVQGKTISMNELKTRLGLTKPYVRAKKTRQTNRHKRAPGKKKNE